MFSMNHNRPAEMDVRAPSFAAVLTDATSKQSRKFMAQVRDALAVIASNFQLEILALGLAASWRVHITSACYLLGFALLTTVCKGQIMVAATSC